MFVSQIQKHTNQAVFLWEERKSDVFIGSHEEILCRYTQKT